MTVNFKLNGKAVSWETSEGELLKDLLKRKGQITIRTSCDGEGSCGSCSAILDRKLVNTCTILALQADGAEIVTISHFNNDRTIGVVQRSLIDSGCVQCGYCTPAVTLAIVDLLARDRNPSEAAIKDALSGTLCRCTGYIQFFTAARLAAKRLDDPGYRAEPIEEFRPDLKHVGKVREKVDAVALAEGQPMFVEDRIGPNTCYLKVLPSPHAHAYIKKIDVSEAEKMPGVVFIGTHENCPDLVYTTAGQGFPEPSPHDRRMFSRKVCHVGDRVAGVLAETEAQAEAALKAIKVEYEVLKPVLTMEDAAAPDAPVIHHGDVKYVVGEPKAGTSTKGNGKDDPIIYQFPIGADPHRNLAASTADGIGDVDRGFAEADAIVESEYIGNRVQCTPLEPHIVLTRMENGRLVIHASTQVPFFVRRIVSRVLGISENKVRVVKERVGGGFGAKQDIVLEDVAAWFTWKTGREVCWRFTREEEFVASRTRHPMKIKVKLGAKKDGKLTAIEMKVRGDTGSFGTHCLTVPMNACSKSLPLILCDNVRFDVKVWYTTMPQAGAYQGYGAPKGSFALQTALAELAEKLGMDQVEIIEKNMVRSGCTIEITKSLGEGRAGSAMHVDKCALDEMLNRGKRDMEWSKPKRQGKGDVAVGRGAAIIMQGSGLPGLDSANAHVKMLADGTFLMLSGGADLGTGLDTVTVKSAAEILGVDMKDVSVVSGDTDMTPFDTGAFASSGTYFSGGAAILAAQDLKAKILKAASEALGEGEADLASVPGGIVRGKKGEITYAKLAHGRMNGDGGGGDLVGTGCFKTHHHGIPYGAHFVEIEIDRRTYDVHLKRYRVYQDCGTPINPELALGQVYGAVMKGIGHSLYEEMLFDDKGKCVNANFLDYKVPTVLETPDDLHVEFVPVEDAVGPFGAKSVSEISLNGAAPAISIAIHDAIGVWVREWPFTQERIMRAAGKLK